MVGATSPVLTAGPKAGIVRSCLAGEEEACFDDEAEDDDDDDLFALDELLEDLADEDADDSLLALELVSLFEGWPLDEVGLPPHDAKAKTLKSMDADKSLSFMIVLRINSLS